jgi:hypothetical protein
LNISSFSFIDSPIFHQFPPIYEDLGLLEVTSFLEQRFEFAYTLGKVVRFGFGSIRLYNKQNEMAIIIPEKLPGIGPKKLDKLKDLLMEQAKVPFVKNIESDQAKQKIYYSDFRSKT